MFTRAGRAALFDRKAFTEAFFDDDAMADGAIVVAVVGAVTYLVLLIRLGGLDGFDLAALFQFVIAGVASWLILGFATWFAATRIFKSSGRPQTLVAMHGLAALPLVADAFGPPVSWAGLVWYLAILVVATKEATELPYKNASVAVLIGFVAAVILRALLRVPFAILGSAFV